MSVDAIMARTVEESIRFLRPGQTHEIVVDEHEIVIAKLVVGDFFLACRTCARLLESNARKPAIPIQRHTDETRIEPSSS